MPAPESGTFTGTAAASGTHRRRQLIIGGKRYELAARDKADASVAATLARFSAGGRGTYVVRGTRGTVNDVDGIIVESITPVAPWQCHSYDYEETAEETLKHVRI